MFQMSHLRNADLFCYWRPNTADVVLILRSKPSLTPCSILHAGQLRPLLLNLSLSFNPLHRDHFSRNSSRWLPASSSLSTNPKHPLALNSHASSIPFLIFMRTRVATEQNNYIFMYVQWKWIHTAYIFMEQTFKTLTLDTKKKKIFIYLCDR